MCAVMHEMVIRRLEVVDVQKLKRVSFDVDIKDLGKLKYVVEDKAIYFNRENGAEV